MKASEGILSNRPTACLKIAGRRGLVALVRSQAHGLGRPFPMTCASRTHTRCKASEKPQAACTPLDDALASRYWTRAFGDCLYSRCPCSCAASFLLIAIPLVRPRRRPERTPPGAAAHRSSPPHTLPVPCCSPVFLSTPPQSPAPPPPPPPSLSGPHPVPILTHNAS